MSYKEMYKEACSKVNPNNKAKERLERTKLQQQNFNNNKKQFGAISNMPNMKESAYRIANKANNFLLQTVNKLNIK